MCCFKNIPVDVLVFGMLCFPSSVEYLAYSQFSGSILSRQQCIHVEIRKYVCCICAFVFFNQQYMLSAVRFLRSPETILSVGPFRLLFPPPMSHQPLFQPCHTSNPCGPAAVLYPVPAYCRLGTYMPSCQRYVDIWSLAVATKAS